MLFAVACCSLSLAVRCRSPFSVALCSLSLAVRCRWLFAVARCWLSLAVRCCSLFIVACCPLSLAVPCRFLFTVACCSLALAVRCRFLFAVARSFFPRSKGNAVFFPHLICRNMHVDNGHQARQPRHQRFPETPGCSTLVRPCGRLYNTSRSPSAGCPTSALGMSRSRAGSDIVQNALMAALAGASPDNADPPAYVSVLSYLCR